MVSEDFVVYAITALYSFSSLVTIAAYFPQIWTLVTATGRSEALSISSWGLWSYTGAVNLLYAVYVVKDLLLSIVALASEAAILITLALILYNRYFRFEKTLPRGVSNDAAAYFHKPSSK
ncbi:MAG: hypothetical protein OXR68_01630 [Alphaproteobacteria bacterium]|nr:hypothetical protein [Alphaproteobacteria bacterium]MDD9919313.1 hypothetical protein [Alphaproteobacteria bacterium]